MIYFDHLPLEKDILEALAELTINYIFQPIFYPDGKNIYAYEALMRPTNMSVTELIAEYEKKDKLHVLEVATFFGATQEFVLRGYTEYLSMNSFPSEAFTVGEGNVYKDYYGDILKKNIVEILEYPYTSSKAVTLKKAASLQEGLQIAIDDFGSGINNMDIVDMYQPHIVKLDRQLISEIDEDKFKQVFVKQHIAEFHRRGIKVIAEGVERKEEFDLLKKYGADFFQGFYLARPA